MIKLENVIYRMSVNGVNIGIVFPDSNFLSYIDHMEIKNQDHQIKTFIGYSGLDKQLERICVALLPFLVDICDNTILVQFGHADRWNTSGIVRITTKHDGAMDLEYRLFDSIPF